jgi:Flp pilus assembly protein TadD/V8-like Glu-specific endopeptidase
MNKIFPIFMGVIAFAPPAIALVADSNTAVKSVTVSIVTADGNGSGVIIKRAGNKYTVLTAAHVVRDTQKSYAIGTADGQTHPISNLRVFPNSIDLAVVDFTSSKTYPVAKFGNSDDAEEGSGAIVSGYPRSDRQVPVYGLRKGRVVANSNKEFADGYGIVYSSSTLPGMSGGGVFNDKGELIAIHGKGDITSNVSLGTGTARVKTGYDLGVPINTFTKISKSVAGITVNQAPANPRNRPRAGDAFLEGLSQYRAKNYPQAISAFSQAIQRDPQDATAYYYRGMVQLSTRDLSAAVSDFDQAIKINPKYALPYVFRGTVLMEKKQLDKAEADFTRGIQLDPSNSYAYLFRGFLNVDPARKRVKESAADIQKSIDVDPTNPMPYFYRGLINYVRKDKPKAVADFSKAAALSKALGDLNGYNDAKNFLEIIEKYGVPTR